MSQPPSPGPVHRVRVERFSTSERWLHRSLAILLGVLILTGAVLLLPAFSGLIGNRPIVRTVHEWSGWLVPIPLLLALLSRTFRADAGRLNRFLPSDWAWLRSRDRRSGRIPVGKFNAGQKLNAAVSLGAIIVMFGTGMVMFWSSLFPDGVRTGATFVHDWAAVAFTILVIGHTAKAYGDPGARAGMRTGYVSEDWARQEHPAWATEALGPRPE